MKHMAVLDQTPKSTSRTRGGRKVEGRVRGGHPVLQDEGKVYTTVCERKKPLNLEGRTQRIKRKKRGRSNLLTKGKNHR